MAEPERPTPAEGEMPEAARRSEEPPPAARIPAPAPDAPPRFGISRAWQALTPAGQWVVALAWAAVLAAAIAGFGLALSGDDESTTASGPTQEAPPATITVPEEPVVEDPVIEDPVIEDPVVEDPVIEEPPVTEAPPLDETDPDGGGLPAPEGEPIYEIAGDGPEVLGEVNVSSDALIVWSNAGGDFQVRTGEGDSATIVVNSTAPDGEAPLAAGVYPMEVVSGGSWSLQIIPV